MRRDVTRLVGTVVSLNRRQWSTNRRGAVFGIVSAVATVVAAHMLVIPLWHGLRAHPVAAAVILVALAWTQRNPVEMRRGSVTTELVFDAGFLVLALALFGPWMGAGVWLLCVAYFELAHRDYLAIAFGNTLISTLAASAAALTQHLLLHDQWWASGLLGGGLGGALLGLVYATVEAGETELASRLIMDRHGDGVDWRAAALAIATGGVLGAAAGLTSGVAGPGTAVGLLAIPLALATWTGQEVADRRREARLTRSLIAGMTRLASADTLAEVHEIVDATAPELATYTAVAVTDEPPDDNPRRLWLPLVDRPGQVVPSRFEHPTAGVEAPAQRWLRATVINYHTHIPAEQRELLEALAATARAATRRILERERTSYALRHDALTGLLNRNGLWEATRGRRPSGASLLLIDLDGFKSVNDVHGHDCGDEVLLAVARGLAAVLPEDAAVARWGGDEFVVQLPRQVGEDELTVLGHRVIAAVEVAAAGVCPDRAVSASIGYAGTDGRSEHVDILELFHRADQSMYDAKRAGKGTVRGSLDEQVHPLGRGAT